MLNLKQIIQNASQVAASLNNRPIGDALVPWLKTLEEPQYRVAFVGQFKTGKSTLINRLILKEDLLFTDIMEATAIPVEISYGDQKRLEVFEYDIPEVPSQTWSSELRCACSIDEPTTEQIREHTSAETAEERASLAKRVSYVHLSWPSESLKSFTVVDTPGINTFNEALATTTYHFLPRCDLAIFVVQPKELAQVDKEFLRGKLFGQGITHAMILIHYDPRYADEESGQLEKIQAHIQATLAQMDRSHIPVVMAPTPSKKKPARISLAEAVKSEDLVPSIEELLKIPSLNFDEPCEEPDPDSAPDSLEREMLSFIHQNLKPGRDAKVASGILPIVERLLAQIQLEISLLNKQESERLALVQEIHQAQQTTKVASDELKKTLWQELHEIKNSQWLHLQSSTQGLYKGWEDKVIKSTSIDDLQKVIKSLQASTVASMEEMVLTVKKQTSEELKCLEKKYELKLKALAQPWVALDEKLQIDGGMLEKLPKSAMPNSDNLLLDIAGFLPFVVRLPIMLLVFVYEFIAQRKADGKILVDAKAQLLKTLKEQFDQAILEMKRQLDAGFEGTSAQVLAHWEEQITKNAAAIDSATQRAIEHPAEDSSGHRLSLQQAAAEVKTLLQALNLQIAR